MKVIQPRYPRPVIAGQYKNIYSPQPRWYAGVDTPALINGQIYKNWIPNDFTLIADPSGHLHAFGITQPRPISFVNSYNFDSEDVHEAENQLFHVVFHQKNLWDNYCFGGVEEKEHILYPHQRPGESAACWAPCIVKKDDLYYLFYGPGNLRLAVSADLNHWTAKGVLFEGPPMTRDPYVIYEAGVYYMLYLTDKLVYRYSTDLLSWSKPEVFQNSYGGSSHQESPCLIKRDGIYYLLWCLYDGQNGCYDNRTLVFASATLNGFQDASPIAMLDGHAAELIEQDGQWFIVSVFYPQNGLNIAPIAWV